MIVTVGDNTIRMPNKDQDEVMMTLIGSSGNDSSDKNSGKKMMISMTMLMKLMMKVVMVIMMIFVLMPVKMFCLFFFFPQLYCNIQYSF